MKLSVVTYSVPGRMEKAVRHSKIAQALALIAAALSLNLGPVVYSAAAQAIHDRDIKSFAFGMTERQIESGPAKDCIRLTEEVSRSYSCVSKEKYLLQFDDVGRAEIITVRFLRDQ